MRLFPKECLHLLADQRHTSRTRRQELLHRCRLELVRRLSGRDGRAERAFNQPMRERFELIAREFSRESAFALRQVEADRGLC